MNSVFNEQILADKLSKLNSTQQCIETLSHWCIFHRKKAELVVQTWDKQFHSSQKEQKVPFLYLANDILQNSRRKGTEFVSEFWKVLPAALKDVFENGDEHGKSTVSRLVTIWEERRVFGSRARGLQHLMLGNEPPLALEFNKKRSRSVRIVRRDSRSIKIKLSIGGIVEKVVSAFHAVISEHPNEDMDLNKCKAAVRRVGKMEKNVDIACAKVDDPRRAPLAEELQEEETLLKQCIEKLKLVEETRSALVSQLKEALKEQESELENVRTQLQVAQAQVEEATNMRKQLNNETVDVRVSPSSSKVNSQMEPTTSAGENSKKTAAAIAAEVADRLAASTSSQQIMTSVLSTFAAEEAKNAGLTTTANPSNSHLEFPAEKRMKLEKPIPVSGAVSGAFIATHQHQMMLMPQPSMQVQASTSQTQYAMLSTPPSQQPYFQPSGGMMMGMPYGYSSLPPPPGPPHLPAQLMNMSGPTTLPQQQPMPLTLQQPAPLTMQQQQQQQPPLLPMAAPMYRPLQPPSMTFYGLPHQPQ